MTTIAAKRVNNSVKIAWDSQVTSGGTATHGMNKVVKINGQFAVGVAGHLRYANLVHRASVSKIHAYDIIQPDFDGYGWICDELIPAWMKSIRGEKEALAEDEPKLPWGHALIALAGSIYSVGADFSVTASGEFDSIGSGSPFAMTAMHLGKTAKAAVEIAKELDLYTGGLVKEMTV